MAHASSFPGLRGKLRLRSLLCEEAGRRRLSYVGKTGVDLCVAQMVHLVEDDRAVKAALLQEGQVKPVIHDSLTSPQLPGFAVMVEVLGMG